MEDREALPLQVLLELIEPLRERDRLRVEDIMAVHVAV